MITKEEILQRLTEERDKASKGKQITDKWIAVRAEKLFASVTEETELEDLIKFTVEVMPEMQANMNSILSVESKRIKEELEKVKQQEIKDEVNPEPTPFVIPKEIQDELDYIKQFRATEIISQKKKEAYEIAKKGIGENQLPLLKLSFKKLNVSADLDSQAIAEMGLSDFNDVLQLSIIPTTIDAPDNKLGDKDKNEELYKAVRDKIQKI